MGKGSVLPSEMSSAKQPETGVRILKLTDAGCRNVHAYYNHEQFLNDSTSLVFHSDRSGLRQLYTVDIGSGKIVQITDAPEGVGGYAVAYARNAVYFGQGDEVRVLDGDSLKEEVVAQTPDGCGPVALEDVSSCGRYLVLSARPRHVLEQRLPPSSFYHGSENIVLLADVDCGEQSVVYHGPTPEVPVAADSHLFISRDDPSYVWFGSYTRRSPTGFKTVWSIECDIESLYPRRDPRPVFDQRPYEFINHYYPAPNAHAQMPLYEYTEWESDGVPLATTRPRAVSRAGNYVAFMLDVDLKSGVSRRWLFPGQPPLHFKGNHADELWAGDCADPGFLWFSGRDAEAVRREETDPELCPAIPENHAYHWSGSGRWIGVFQKRGAFLEMRPLVQHDTQWEWVHPHPSFSPDDKWVVYGAGDEGQSQVYLAEAVWPQWFM